MTWISSSPGDWHYIVKSGAKGTETGCGMVIAKEEYEMGIRHQGDEPPFIRIFDPPMPICQGCSNYRTLNDLAE